MFGLGFIRNRNPLAAAGSVQAAVPCFHCGLPVPAGLADSIVFDGLRRPMCCAGCVAAAEMIIGAGFADHYRGRAGEALAGAAPVAEFPHE